ncbi:hypothetical protein HXX76_006997 [Chlamydomonas incerta]|uniref:Mitochondrial carrier protein n=1 Tax=Chlamydomonas incerta TaxID=51695 RepID=A0A835TCQ4_CHLIN|nr:hypothetical protein HXX76_006997 [Chlamydomonas incerta]|eukprot:KAG2435801.1 hypothetical protein HXX76_006997 [Chlamydomonas incerta]
MQANAKSAPAAAAPAAGSAAAAAAALPRARMQAALQRALTEAKVLYKGVAGAATGAGIIIGAFFAFYSTSKRLLREKTDLPDGTVAFIAGAVAAVGSSVVKVPIAVCIRSVQAGVYPNVFAAARSVVDKAGPGGLFTGFLPTLLEDVPDMAVKFAVYETLRAVHMRLHNDERPSTLEDLLMGGIAGSAAAAATTPLDVVKTRMMCSASERPTITQAVRGILGERPGLGVFFRGVGPRALSNGLNSAIFYCWFEILRAHLAEALVRKQREQQLLLQAGAAGRGGASDKVVPTLLQSQPPPSQQQAVVVVSPPASSSASSSSASAAPASAAAAPAPAAASGTGSGTAPPPRGGHQAVACVSLARAGLRPASGAGTGTACSPTAGSAAAVPMGSQGAAASAAPSGNGRGAGAVAQGSIEPTSSTAASCNGAAASSQPGAGRHWAASSRGHGSGLFGGSGGGHGLASGASGPLACLSLALPVGRRPHGLGAWGLM